MSSNDCLSLMKTHTSTFQQTGQISSHRFHATSGFSVYKFPQMKHSLDSEICATL